MTDASVNSNTESRIGNPTGMGSIGVQGAVEKYPDFLRFLKNHAILFQNYFLKSILPTYTCYVCYLRGRFPLQSMK